MRARVLAAASLLVLSCQPGPPGPMYAPGPQPAPGPGPVEPAPIAGCDVLFAAAFDGDVLTVTAHNHGPAEVTFSLPDRCPAGPLAFEGLPDGFDVYSTCAMGACPDDLPPRSYTVPAGGSVEVVRTALALGGDACNAAVAVGGSYSIMAIVPDDLGIAACATPAVVTPGGGGEPVQEPPPQASQVDPRACTADADCEVYCPDVEGCCGWSCGCRNAINRNHRDVFTAQHAQSCERQPDCPAMGCAYEPAHAAECVNGRCRAARW